MKLLYVTPEKVAGSGAFQDVLQHMHRNGQLARFVIDEAHCVRCVVSEGCGKGLLF